MKWRDAIRENQLKLSEEARRRGDVPAAEPKKPWRDSAYGKLRGKVSVRAMDIVIWAIVGLIAAAVLIGLIVR